MKRTGLAAGLVCALMSAACSGDGTSGGTSAPTGTPQAVVDTGTVDVGGYELVYECRGTGSPTVLLEAGYDSAGTSTWLDLLPEVAQITRVCTYDRAGTGTSQARPQSMAPLRGEQIAAELHSVLEGVGESGPYVLVGHSYGGLLVRVFGAAYPDEVAGMVVIDASSEPEIPIYERLDAGAWVDGGTRVDIDEVADEVRRVRLGSSPLVVLTAEIIEDEWLKTVPDQAAAAQARLATLSSNVVHVLAPDTGHFIQDHEPALVMESIRQVLEAARSGGELATCGKAFEGAGGECVPQGETPTLQPA